MDLFNYLRHLEWTLKIQENCTFCEENKFEDKILCRDNVATAINNRRSAGRHHYIIFPTQHDIRDIEHLEVKHIPILLAMDRVMKQLLAGLDPPAKSVHAGYHRGRRQVAGDVFFPDIVSIHHLHLHVIVEPDFWPVVLKYPTYNPLMWKSHTQVLEELQAKSRALPPPPAGGTEPEEAAAARDAVKLPGDVAGLAKIQGPP